MGTCNGFHPTHQAQLTAQWGGPHGNVNCTACSAGMVAEAETCGELRFTGSQIRAASDEPIPKAESPGLNLTQVETALRTLSHGRIDLETRNKYPFDKLQKRITNGAQAILQIQRSAFIAAGESHGNAFAGGHAIAIGADGGQPWFDDPLTGRFPTTWETLRKAAGQLKFGDGTTCGDGKAYVSFSRDITREVAPEAPAGRVSVARGPGEAKHPFGLFTVRDRAVVTARRARTGGFSADCGRPRLYSWAGHPSQSLVVLMSGALADQANSNGVIYAIRSAYMQEP